MSTKSLTSLNVPRYCFWDCDYENLDIHEDRDLIIPRAFYATNKDSFEKDVARLESVYSKDEILSELQKTSELVSNQVCELVAERYNVNRFSRF